MSRLDPGLHLHALVARMDRPPPSKRTHAGSNPAESSVAWRWMQRTRIGVAINNYGELAERQGIAVLTRRDLRVGQVRLLHSPPIRGAGMTGSAFGYMPPQRLCFASAFLNASLSPGDHLS